MEKRAESGSCVRHDGPVGQHEDELATAHILLDEARREEDLQNQIGGTYDQTSGIIVGLSGVVVTVVLSQDGPGWAGVLTAALAGMAGAVAIRALTYRHTIALGAARSISKYTFAAPVVAALGLAWSRSQVNDHRANRLRVKRRLVLTAAILALASVEALLVGLTVDPYWGGAT